MSLTKNPEYPPKGMLSGFRRLAPATFRARLWILFGALCLMLTIAATVWQVLVRRAERYLGLLAAHTTSVGATHLHVAHAHLMGLGLLGATIAAGAMALSLILRTFKRRLKTLADGARRLTREDFSARFPETCQDELGNLMRDFNQTAATLERSQDALLEAGTKLEMRILERTAALEAANRQLEAEVAERKGIENRLRQSEQGLLALINNATEYALFSLDAEGRVNSWNEGAQRLYGYSTEFIIGKPADALYQDRNGASVNLVELLETALKTGHSRIKGRQRRQNGDSFLAYSVIQAIFDEQKNLKGYCGITQDLTEQQEAREELAQLKKQLLHEQKLQTIGTLAAGISHDFNNIIAVILGHAELIREQGLVRPESVRSLDSVLAASKRAADLVKQIQGFCRNETSEFGPVDLRLVITETASLLKGTLPSTISLRLELGMEAAFVEGNAGQLQQVILNLATNARDAMINETGSLTIRLFEGTADPILPEAAGLGKGSQIPRCARLTVSDNGTGMDARTLDRIFEPFFTTKPAGRGTGLGLAVVQRILKAHHATCSVDSQPGKGTTFHIDFPLSHKPLLPSQTASFIRHEEFRGSDARVLVVDDEPELLDGIGTILKNHGYRVSKANSGRKAIDLLTSDGNRFDLLLTDRTMPETDGCDLVRQIRNLDLGLPVVLMTGLVGPDEMALHESGLVNGLLQKPIEAERLLRKIASVLTKQNRDGLMDDCVSRRRPIELCAEGDGLTRA